MSLLAATNFTAISNPRLRVSGMTIEYAYLDRHPRYLVIHDALALRSAEAFLGQVSTTIANRAPQDEPLNLVERAIGNPHDPTTAFHSVRTYPRVIGLGYDAFRAVPLSSTEVAAHLDVSPTELDRVVEVVTDGRLPWVSAFSGLERIAPPTHWTITPVSNRRLRISGAVILHKALSAVPAALVVHDAPDHGRSQDFLAWVINSLSRRLGHEYVAIERAIGDVAHAEPIFCQVRVERIARANSLTVHSGATLTEAEVAQQLYALPAELNTIVQQVDDAYRGWRPSFLSPAPLTLVQIGTAVTVSSVPMHMGQLLSARPGEGGRANVIEDAVSTAGTTSDANSSAMQDQS